ncbi:aldehyde dehydrogenase family protein [Prescottella subtropica]|uniref:aldehyde dehydrogenase family protein n=1 Tax=Prescottella subtropica TaxID=2545757 RepID=UPI0010F52574|nr:aldehyde dehydrogenase family protein [Prescottella subtropica]
MSETVIVTTPIAELPRILDTQKRAAVEQGPASADVRRDRLQRMIDLLVRHHKPLTEAIDTDFGGRLAAYSIMNDILGSLTSLKHTRDAFESWMADVERPAFAPYDQLGARAYVQYQAKGSVGIIGTWNAPLFTLLSPLACALGAGNRAILKPSEIVPRTAQVLADAVAEVFDPSEIAVVTGGPDLADTFTSLPFDHLVFTGSTEVGKLVMANAAKNLVPVTLELGGKSPTVVGRSADLDAAANKIAIAKASNGGQLCVSPDVVYVPREHLDTFVESLEKSYASLLPTITDNPDVVAIVSDRHLARVEGLVADARDRGALIVATPVDESTRVDGDRKRPLRLVVSPPEDSKIMQEEIFGPAVILLPYDQTEDVIADINSRPKPLALYYFGTDPVEQHTVLSRTSSGGVTVNDVMMHPGMTDAPFGGVGASGMGHYHGREGFLEFSHTRTVFEAPGHDPRAEWGTLPPYGDGFLEAMQAQVTP